jgi:dienelactone hydrolase
MLEPLAYADGETALAGWLARPSGKARGAMVVFPTIANVNDHMRRRAAMLAEAGFVALIADFYGVEVDSFEQAGALASKLREDAGIYRRRLVAALRTLKQAAPELPMGAIGYCMGGQAALEVARSGEDLALVASFHGLLETARKADQPIPARILVCHGDADPLVPRDHVLGFWQEMDAVGARWHFHSYSGVRHGFTDPASDARGLPAIGYDASADRQSWAALMAMCDEVFG